MLPLSQSRTIGLSLRRLFASKRPPKLSDLFAQKKSSEKVEVFGGPKFNPLPRLTFDDIHQFKNQKNQLYELIHASIKSNHFIHDIEKLMDTCKQNHDNYITLLEILSSDTEIFEEIPHNFHKSIINHLVKKNAHMNIIHWCKIFHFLKKFYKAKQETEMVSNLFNNAEDELVRHIYDPDVVFTLSSQFPMKFLDIIDQIDFKGLSEAEVWNILGHIVHSTDEVTMPKFIQAIFKLNFIEKISEIEYFINNIDVYLYAQNRLNDKELSKKNPELSVLIEKVDQAIKSQSLKVFRYGNLREIKQFLPKLDNFDNYFQRFGDVFFQSCFELINYDRLMVISSSNFDKLLFSLVYGHFGFKYELIAQRSKIIDHIEQILTKFSAKEKFPERISDRQFEQLIKFLYNVNHHYIVALKSGMMTEGLNKAVFDILDFKIPKIVAKGNISTALTIKLYAFLMLNVEYFESRDPQLSEDFLLNIKRIEFLLAEKMVYWSYEPQTAIHLKKILGFLHRKFIGSIKFKQILGMALENADKEERRKVYEAYQRVKEAKMGLENKISSSRKRKHQNSN